MSNGQIPENDFGTCLSSYLTANPSYSKVTINSSNVITSATVTADMQKINTEEGYAFMTKMREIAAKAPGDTFPYMPEFLNYETDEIILPSTLTTIGGSALIILIVLIITMRDVIASLIVMFNVCCVVTSVLGSLHWWGLELNSVTAAHLFMSVGVSVDYSAHFIHE